MPHAEIIIAKRWLHRSSPAESAGPWPRRGEGYSKGPIFREAVQHNTLHIELVALQREQVFAAD